MTVKPKGLLIDITRCIGCDACSENCKAVNNLPPKIAPELESDTWTVVYDRGNGRYVRNLCRHCDEPACVSCCPVGALEKKPYGPVLYDKSICLGCRYCMTACTFRIMTFEWYSYNPRIRKCILCEPRIKAGKGAGCADICPTEATVFGERDALAEIAKARIAAEPERYYDYIYGLEEAGGTCVLFLAAEPFEKLGFDTTVPKFPLPDLTWQVLNKVPHIVGVGGAVMIGSYFLFKRRAAVAEAEAKAKQQKTVKAVNKEGGND